jgi:trk system potassium uptake protein TrkH
VDNTIIDEGLQRSVLTFFLLYIGIVGFGVIFLSAIGCPTETSFTAVAATLNNIGPGLELVGAVEPYNVIPDPGKILLSLFMAMGRLELYAICVLLIPSFWFRT